MRLQFLLMLTSPVFLPLLHGEAGLLDEVLLFGAPILVLIVILVIASRRSRHKPAARARARSDSAPPDDAAPPTKPE